MSGPASPGSGAGAPPSRVRARIRVTGVVMGVWLRQWAAD